MRSWKGAKTTFGIDKKARQRVNNKLSPSALQSCSISPSTISHLLQIILPKRKKHRQPCISATLSFPSSSWLLVPTRSLLSVALTTSYVFPLFTIAISLPPISFISWSRGPCPHQSKASMLTWSVHCRIAWGIAPVVVRPSTVPIHTYVQSVPSFLLETRRLSMVGRANR